MTAKTSLNDATWFKSSYSGGEGNECVEVAALPDQIAIRDSKHPDGPALAFRAAAFAAFIDGVRNAD
ncbi:DUF397 domain-containing protein [Streptomyces sp. NPDC101150]|uniref:DUF397 domain-containing protein n=1 Tax=Streptomyces sp. NPDC101150 TaxID=3366114 RepID=UPI003829D683